jgi:hypothetical protein
MTFIFTCDLDWGPEWAIRELIRVFKEYKVPLTLFLTHDSKVAKTEYDNSRMRKYVGVHPNFCDGSTQGKTPVQIIDFCKKLWPAAKSYRCHRYYVTPVTQLLLAATYKYDSNLLLFLQENIKPFQDANGLVQFPVFWEDDAHFAAGLPFYVEALKPKLLTEDLKIFNFHPVWFSFIAPNHVKEFTFLEDLLAFVEESGEERCYLDDYYTHSISACALLEPASVAR